MFKAGRLGVCSFLAAGLLIACTAGGEEGAEEADVASASLSEDQVASAYTCAAAGVGAVAGTAAAVTCGLGAAPSGGTTVLCYVAGSGTAVAGGLAYCGSRCPGFRDFCPGYAPPSFRPTSRLVSRCLGTVRYSRWELTDASLIARYGRTRPEFENGTCACPRGRVCPTP